MRITKNMDSKMTNGLRKSASSIALNGQQHSDHYSPADNRCDNKRYPWTMSSQLLMEVLMGTLRRRKTNLSIVQYRLVTRSKSSVRLLVGLCLGVAISLAIIPFFEDRCVVSHVTERSDNVDEDEEDYEPEVKPIPTAAADEEDAESDDEKGKPVKKYRPLYLSDELGIREKLFISVLTDAQSIDTRAVAVNKTANHLAQKMIFFMNGKPKTVPHGLPVVPFTKNSSQMLPFEAIKYISDHYLNSYDWFYFFPDSTYLNVESLTELVDHVSIGQNLMIGKPVKIEGDKVSACDLVAGILLSRNIMIFLVQNLDWCIGNSNRNDSNAQAMQTCLTYAAKALNITCFDTINELTYDHYVKPSLEVSDILIGDQVPLITKAIAIGSLRTKTDYYRIHRFLCQHEMKVIRNELNELIQEIVNVAPLTPEGTKSLVWPIGVNPPTTPINRFDLIRWDYFTETHIYYQNDFSNIQQLNGVNKQDVQDIIKTAQDRLNEKYENRFLQVRLVNGYRRYDAMRGMEYVLDLMLTDEQTSNDVFKRVHLLRPLGDSEFIPMPNVAENTRINLFLIVHPTEKDAVLGFLESFESVCLKSGDSSYLYVVLIYETPLQEKEDIYALVKSTVVAYQSQYRNTTRITLTPMKSGSAGKVMTSYVALNLLSRRLPSDSLVLRCTVGMTLSSEYLNRVRMNTIKGWQVFFPIGFWSYKPNLIHDHPPYPATIDINKNSGYFDTHQYVHASFYIDDFLYAKKRLTSTGSLSEDLDLYDLFLQYHTLHVFRAIEPALKLQFCLHNCTKLTGQAKADCLESRGNGLASQQQLGVLVLEYQQKYEHKAVVKPRTNKKPQTNKTGGKMKPVVPK